ncbi:MAG: sulfite exporter TauE/SafE family protein [Myxococcales bacterium]|nr:sulfite exporter TauE/SafE family protein [Myxococcales bacterium]
MTFATAAFLFAAAALGGAINSVAGGGSFVAFPALLLAHVPAIAANATNSIALWPGSAASVLAYRREIREVRRELVPLGLAALIGGLAGSVLLLRTSDSAFVALVPWLLLFATLLFSFAGPVQRRLKGVRASLRVAVAAQLVISIYGGYFGGGMGIMMLAVLSLLGMTDIHRMNALKTALATAVNGIAVAAFVIAGAVDWPPGIVMIAGGIVGGYAGAAVARRLPPAHVRRFVLVVAWTMTIYFFAVTYGPKR